MKYGRIVVIALVLIALSAYFYLERAESDIRLTLPKYGPREAKGPGDTVYHVIPEFSLTDQNGNTVTRKDLLGNIHVADFFFAQCKGICLDMSTNLSKVQNMYPENENFRIISYSVDPERDSVKALKAYAESYGANDERWLFVTGDKGVLEGQGKGYFLTAIGENGFFDHAPNFALVDAQGMIRGYYDGTDEASLVDLQKHIGYLFWEMENLKKKD